MWNENTITYLIVYIHNNLLIVRNYLLNWFRNDIRVLFVNCSARYAGSVFAPAKIPLYSRSICSNVKA